MVKIDCALTEKNIPEGYVLGNGANSWYAFFADSLAKENAVLLKDSGYSISFGFLNANPGSKTLKTTEMKARESAYEKQLAKDNRAVIYQDVFNGVDIAYTTQTSALKEDIILKNASATNTFDVKISTEGVLAREQDDTVVFVNKDNKEIFRLAPLYMVDANEKYSENVKFTLKQSDGHVILTIEADESFLTEPDTKFPVVVDPTILVTGANNTFDSYVSQQSPNSNYYTSQALCTGTNTVYDLRRSFIKFDLPAYISANQVTGASLNLKYSMSFMDNAPNVKVHPVQSGWSSSAVTWNNQPSYSSNPSSNIATHVGNNWYSMNVTTMVKNWLAGYTNNGFVLKATTEPSNYANYTNFYSSDAPSPNKPELIISYTNLPVNTVSVRKITDETYREEYSSYTTKINNYMSDIATPFSSKWSIQFSHHSWVSNSTLPAADCSLANNERCHDHTSVCGTTCQDNTSTPNHHKNHYRNWHLLYNGGQGTADITIGFLGFYPCSAGGLSSNWLSTVCQPNLSNWTLNYNRRTLQHEISHLFGCDDPESGDGCTPGEPCIMSGGFDNTSEMNQSNIWCSNCANDFNRLAH